MKKLISFFLAVSMLLGVLAVTVSAADSISSKVEEFKRTRYPEGSTYVDNRDKYGGRQCFGFANELAVYLFGSYPTGSESASWVNSGWTVVHGAGAIDNLVAGDIVRYGNHSIFITRVRGDDVYYAQANVGGPNLVTYNNDPYTKSKLKEMVERPLKDETVIKGWVAHYTKNNQKSKVLLNKEGGIGGTSSTYATFGQALSKITVPTKSGYTFGGYYTEKNGEGIKYYTANGDGAEIWDINSTQVQLYAKWTAKQPAPIVSKVLLNKEGGIGGTSSTYATYGQALSAITVPTKSGYTFGGYYTEKNGEGIKYYTANGDGAEIWYITTTPVQLYAKWTAKQPAPAVSTVTLNKDGGTGGASTVTATNGKALSKISVPAKSGYTFGGYYTGTNGSGTQYYNANGEGVRNWDKTASSVTLYAKWTANQPAPAADSGYSTSYEGTYTTYNVTSSLRLRKEPNTNADVLAYIQPNDSFYVIKSNGEWAYVKYNEIQGYVSCEFIKRINTEAGKTTIKLNKDGGTGGASSVTATYGKALSKIAVPTKSGYTFGGYYTGTNGTGTQYYQANGESARKWDKTASSVTLYAKWTKEAIQKYTK